MTDSISHDTLCKRVLALSPLNRAAMVNHANATFHTKLNLDEVMYDSSYSATLIHCAKKKFCELIEHMSSVEFYALLSLAQSRGMNPNHGLLRNMATAENTAALQRENDRYVIRNEIKKLSDLEVHLLNNYLEMSK